MYKVAYVDKYYLYEYKFILKYQVRVNFKKYIRSCLCIGCLEGEVSIKPTPDVTGSVKVACCNS